MVRPNPKLAWCVAWLLPSVLAAQQEPLQARAGVENTRVYVGQQFLLQIQVQGTDQPDPLDLGPLEPVFTVSEAGGGPSNSTQVSIVNGRMTRQVQRGYNFNYRLAARTAGDHVIPALTISVSGRSARTQPIALRVLPPQENDDFKLRMSLSETRAYVGQPVRLTVAWYIGREVRDFSFTMPLLDDRRFDVLESDSALSAANRAQASDEVMEIQLGDRRATARKGRGEVDGRSYTLLRFEKLLIPRTRGDIVLPAATVTFVTPGPGQSRPRGMLDDFFGGGFFSGVFGRQRLLETLAIPSNRPRLAVLDLPAAGRPAGFNGWIGEFQIQAEGKPTSVAVGEPITLSLRVRGPGMLATAQLPPLDQQPALAQDFKIPREMATGENRGGARYFTQTLRAKHDGVTQIPPIELNYFSPNARAYRTARSEPVPLEVEASRIVTAEDAEGSGVAEPRQLEVASSEQGIAHNYVDASALEPTAGGWGLWLRPMGPAPLSLVLLAMPPLVCLGLLAVRLNKKHGGLPWWRTRSAHAQWRASVNAIDLEGLTGSEAAAAVLAALRTYLDARVGDADSGRVAWTYAEAAGRLRAVGDESNGRITPPDNETLAALRDVFERCEAGTYAATAQADMEWRSQLVSDAQAAVDRIEESRR